MSIDWKSSYDINNYGELFYSLVKIYKPLKIVEFGSKTGYSAYHFAKGLKENGSGSIDCYDLWENSPYKSCSLIEIKENLKNFSKFVNFFSKDVLSKQSKILSQYSSVDFLHIDLGNHADHLDQILLPWLPKVNQLAFFEGGSLERDQVEWMQKFNKRPILKWLETHSNEIDYFTLNPFPSLTLIRKKINRPLS